MAAKKKPFEESMARLEEIVSILERGESTLDESWRSLRRAPSWRLPVPSSWIRRNRRF